MFGFSLLMIMHKKTYLRSGGLEVRVLCVCEFDSSVHLPEVQSRVTHEKVKKNFLFLKGVEFELRRKH